MKLDKTFDLLRDRVSPPKSGKVGNLLKVAAGTAATVWVLLQLRRELYGPGGTRMSRYDPDVDELENADELRARVEDAREEADAQA